MLQKPEVPIPKGWPEHARSAVLHVVSVAHWSLVSVRGWCADSRIRRVRLKGQVEQLESEVALLTEELRIKDARMARLAPRNRPQYPPVERWAILNLKAARAWSATRTAERFGLTPPTVGNWLRRVEEKGSDALVQIPRPINRFPDFVSEIVTRLKLTFPHLGRRLTADLLARAGLHLSASTVRRMLKRAGGGPEPRRGSPQQGQPPAADVTVTDTEKPRTVTAKRPGHFWHADLTAIPLLGGFWIPWFPQALAQCWPFCFWVAVVLDHYSRKVVGTEVFRRPPSGLEVCQLLDRCVDSAGQAPRHMVTDKGHQFRSPYREWCQRNDVRPRFGAVGQHGSIALVERCIRTVKDTGFRRRVLPLGHDDMTAEVNATVDWYNSRRPHSALGGATPNERYARRRPARRAPRFEPRARYPVGETKLRAPSGTELTLVTRHFRGRKYLPIIRLKAAA